MPTKRRRVTRQSQLSQQALNWLESEDAHLFFTDPTYQPEGYNGPIGNLPGVRPWWLPLHEVWRRHLAGLPLQPDGYRVGDERAQMALDFVLALHDEFKRSASERD